ncbi:Dimethylmenaquinone methyltransferase [uncultured delta proteobacterium]|uniref:Regulator of ribonuclease activity homolog n=1 Tax=uncultured delta proteobacterium TaxID=34034 RepID=A0A212JF37_9DELT|nr:Dimethylmenaquinone methyltransferase [uncultured delta proteobacterium]
MSNPGFRIKKSFPRPDKALVEAFANIPVANIGDNMNRVACMNARVRPMNAGRLLGCAFTVKVRAGDNLLFHKAIDMAQPGDIIVIDAQNEQSYAIFGELMIMWLRRRGITGVVVDGCIRDYDAISKMNDIAIYATGITPNGPLKEGGGEINFPVMCGGLVVNPGDIIVGDSDGVVAINPADAPDVLKKALAHNAKEAQTMKDIEKLAWDRSWVDAALTAKGCEFID